MTGCEAGGRGVFSAMLDGLPATVGLVLDGGGAGLAAALDDGRGRVAVAVGSGGSVVVAHYLASCRSALGAGATLPMTPLGFATSGADLREAEVWLISAKGGNPDILAAQEAARRRGVARVRILTTDGEGGLAAGAGPGDDVHVLPVASARDGFLATHSLVATVTGLLQATEGLLGRGEASCQQVARAAAAGMGGWARTGGGLGRDGVLLVLHDPRLAAAAAVIETSLWESAIRAVRAVDLWAAVRVWGAWAGSRPAETAVVALTGDGAREVWREIERGLPDGGAREGMDYGSCGPVDAARAILDGMRLVETLGALAGIDPGRPAVPDFGKWIYAQDSLGRAVRRRGGVSL